MAYPVKEMLVSKNRSYEYLQPIGLVLHETANPDSGVGNHFSYFNNAYRGAMAHYFVDFESIGRFCPENEVAWHAGYKANRRYLSIEMCHYKDPVKFKEVYKRTVWLAADMFYRYGWAIDTNKTLVTHEWVTKNLGGTNHVDPTQYLKSHGLVFNDFVADVKKELAAMKAPKETIKPVPPEKAVAVYVQGVKVSDQGVLIQGRTLVPVKDVAKAYGCTVGFDNSNKQAIVNKEYLETTVLRENVSYAWVRDVADAMRANILWEAETLTVYLT